MYSVEWLKERDSMAVDNIARMLALSKKSGTSGGTGISKNDVLDIEHLIDGDILEWDEKLGKIIDSGRTIKDIDDKISKSNGNPKVVSFIEIDENGMTQYTPKSNYLTVSQISTDINPVVNLSEDNPEAAVQGVLREDQLATLQGSENAYIMFNHKKYNLEGDGVVEGYLTYSYTGYENSEHVLESITITINTRGWVLTRTALGLKYHTLNFITANGSGYFGIQSHSLSEYTLSKIKDIMENEKLIVNGAYINSEDSVYSLIYLLKTDSDLKVGYINDEHKITEEIIVEVNDVSVVNVR